MRFLIKIAQITLLLINIPLMWVGGLIVGFFFAVKGFGLLHAIMPIIMFTLLGYSLYRVYKIVSE